jgi:exosortase
LSSWGIPIIPSGRKKSAPSQTLCQLAFHFIRQRTATPCSSVSYINIITHSAPGELFAVILDQMHRLNSYPGALGLLVVSFLALYWRVLHKLVLDWANDGNYSHGFFIVPLAAFFVWERRKVLAATPVQPSWVGLFVMVASIAVLLAGLLGAELFLSRISIIGLLVGAILFVLGWRHLGKLAFPLVFLLLMIPIPAIIFNQIAFPLQLLASQTGEVVLRAFDIPVLREGNVIILANTKLEVAEACSGIRSLISLLTLGIVYGYFLDARFWVRFLIAAATIPVAIVTNALRVAGTGVAAHYYGPEAAEGFFHEFSGLIVFAAAFALLFAIARLILLMLPPRDNTPVGAPSPIGQRT